MKKLFLLKVFIFSLIALTVFLPSYAYAQEKDVLEKELLNNNHIINALGSLNQNTLDIRDTQLFLTKIKAPILPNQKTITDAILPPEEIFLVNEVKSAETMNTKKETKEDVKESTEITVTATAYTAYCNGCSGITATGINLRKNPDAKVIAVDPKVIPLGSKVYVPGYGEAIAGDKGGAIKGNKIDVFFKSKTSAINWGKQKVTITVFE